MNYDLKLFSLNFVQGQMQADVLGLFVSTAPKRAARGRQEDCLIIHIDLHHKKPLSAAQEAWLANLVNVFYKTPGSVTSAMSVVIEMLSNYVLDSNLQIVSDQERMSAYLNMAVIHHDNLFIAQIGTMHAYWVGNTGLAHFYDADANDRGLGLTRSPQVRYYQHELNSGDCFISTLSAPENWQADQITTAGSFEQFMRRLHHNLPATMNGALVQILEGSGKVIPLQSISLAKASNADKDEAQLPNETLPGDETLTDEAATMETEEALEEVQEETHGVDETDELVDGEADDDIDEEENFDDIDIDIDIDLEDEDALADDEELGDEIDHMADVQMQDWDGLDEQSLDDSLADDLSQQNEDPLLAGELPGVDATQMDWQEQSEGEPMEEPTQPKVRPDRKNQGLKLMAKFFNWYDRQAASISAFFKPIKQRLVATTGLQENSLSKSTMLAIAIIIPLLIVSLAASVYIVRGKNRQFDYLLAQTQAAAANAQLISGEPAMRTAWQEVLNWADEARQYGKSAEIDQLAAQAQSVLDVLDGATRLAYQPAINGVLPNGLVISRIVPITNDLYLLDSAGGRVIHLTFGNLGYEIDSNFVCESGTYNGVTVGSLIGLVEIPINNDYRAPIMAVDDAANVLYCSKGNAPVAASLLQPSDGVGKIRSALWDAGNLYLLDPQRNAVWIYYGESSQFTTQGISFFEKFPIELGKTVNLAINGDEVYLLYEDGHLANCVAAGFSTDTIQCTNPAMVKDKDNSAQILDTDTLQFNQMRYQSQRDPSLLLLAPRSGELYQLSSQLTLNRVFRNNLAEQFEGGQTATAFAISANRNAFIAIGNKLYYARMP